MRILLTGAGGFVGHHTLAHLLKTTDFEFVITDSFNHRGTSARLRSVFTEIPNSEKRVKVITHDLTTPIDTVTAQEIGNVNIVISMASESHVDRSILSPREFIQNNTSLILTLLDFSKNLQNLELFLQISTDEVYGPAALGTAHKEWESHFPSNPYSASKAAQESICYSYWRTFGIPMVITNTMNIIGERQDTEKFVPMTIRNILSGAKVPVHAKLHEGKWISGSRFYLHARNQADALRYLVLNRHKIALAYSETTKNMEKFHVVGELELANDEMVELISEFLEKKALIEYVDFHKSRPGHDLRYALDGTKIKNFGWTPPLSLHDSLKKTTSWYLNNKNWL